MVRRNLREITYNFYSRHWFTVWSRYAMEIYSTPSTISFNKKCKCKKQLVDWFFTSLFHHKVSQMNDNNNYGQSSPIAWDPGVLLEKGGHRGF